MCNAHAPPLHRVTCCLWDHHFPLPALPQALVCAKLPLPLSSSKLQALFALGFPRVSQDGCTCPLMSLFTGLQRKERALLSEGWLWAELPCPLGACGLSSQLHLGMIRLCECNLLKMAQSY